jgi:hypothetical protein
MLVLAMFILICFAAVLFLLRFLFALSSEIRSERKRPKARVDHITTYRIPYGNRVQDAARVLTAVHPSSWQHDARVHPISIDSRGRNSQVKEA